MNVKGYLHLNIHEDNKLGLFFDKEQVYQQTTGGSYVQRFCEWVDEDGFTWDMLF